MNKDICVFKHQWSNYCVNFGCDSPGVCVSANVREGFFSWAKKLAGESIAAFDNGSIFFLHFDILFFDVFDNFFNSFLGIVQSNFFVVNGFKKVRSSAYIVLSCFEYFFQVVYPFCENSQNRRMFGWEFFVLFLLSGEFLHKVWYFLSDLKDLLSVLMLLLVIFQFFLNIDLTEWRFFYLFEDYVFLISV